MKDYGDGWTVGRDGNNVRITYEDIDPYMGGELLLSREEWLALIDEIGMD